MRMVRQGDVLLLETTVDISKFEHAEVPRERGTIVLAHGEATGHAHRVVGPSACLLRLEGISDLVLTLGSAARLVHEEHGAIDLGPGTYFVRRQREYAPGMIRHVED